ncbi:hypothetical protein QR665_21920 [Acinetobacter gerneri]|uniref:hypothetical protein n=1 Tax=Acinetobacter gerneri TaxID=202952 RepID=UPI0029360328|nr:hypothetical protein [Acinetobacter gerneri]MDV2442057.1 hypothetical protein [Acinetobacter gerneri]
MVVHLFLNNNKALDFLSINSIKNGGYYFAQDIAQALDVNVSFLENLVGMEVPRKPRVLIIVKKAPEGAFYILKFI